MIYKEYFHTANHIVQDSLLDVAQGQYLRSWSRMVPARIAFLADAVVNIALTPISALGTLLGALEFVFTWGEESSLLRKNLTALDDNINCSIRSSLGAVISPTAAYRMRDVNLIFATCIALIVCAPNLLFYSPNHGWSFGWAL